MHAGASIEDGADDRSQGLSRGSLGDFIDNDLDDNANACNPAVWQYTPLTMHAVQVPALRLVQTTAARGGCVTARATTSTTTWAMLLLMATRLLSDGHTTRRVCCAGASIAEGADDRSQGLSRGSLGDFIDNDLDDDADARPDSAQDRDPSPQEAARPRMGGPRLHRQQDAIQPGSTPFGEHAYWLTTSVRMGGLRLHRQQDVSLAPVQLVSCMHVTPAFEASAALTVEPSDVMSAFDMNSNIDKGLARASGSTPAPEEQLSLRHLFILTSKQVAVWINCHARTKAQGPAA